jgi:hypothetical protein
MYIALFFFACYLMRWSIATLNSEVAVGPLETLGLFGVGMMTVPLAGWAGLHMVMS